MILRQTGPIENRDKEEEQSQRKGVTKDREQSTIGTQAFKALRQRPHKEEKAEENEEEASGRARVFTNRREQNSTTSFGKAGEHHL